MWAVVSVHLEVCGLFARGKISGMEESDGIGALACRVSVCVAIEEVSKFSAVKFLLLYAIGAMLELSEFK